MKQQKSTEFSIKRLGNYSYKCWPWFNVSKLIFCDCATNAPFREVKIPLWVRTPQVGNPWYGLRKGVVTEHTTGGDQHQRWTVANKLPWHGHNFLSRNAGAWQSATDGRQHRTTAKLPKAFPQEFPSYAFSSSTKHVHMFFVIFHSYFLCVFSMNQCSL